MKLFKSINIPNVPWNHETILWRRFRMNSRIAHNISGQAIAWAQQTRRQVHTEDLRISSRLRLVAVGLDT